MSSCLLMFPGIRSTLMFSSFGVKPLASGFQSLFLWSVVPFYCGGFSQWVGLDNWLVKVSWLGKLVSVFCCVEMDFFSLECNGVPSNEFCDGFMC